MGIFKSLFGKKDNQDAPQPQSTPVVNTSAQRSPVSSPKLHMRGKPDEKGLYPGELVLLHVAERYKVSETNYPGHLTYQYEIANPVKALKNLQSRGFIEVGSAYDALPSYKVNELKEIAAAIGVTVKGKKADIISQLSEIEESKIGAFVKDRNWKRTAAGQAALDANPYIDYFLGKHDYNVTEVGVNIWTVNEDFLKNPRQPYRDVIYRQLNKQMNDAYIAFNKNPNSGNADTYRYCECYRLMGLFIEEEGKSFVNAADFYFQYIFKRINIHAGLQLLKSYQLFKNDKKYQSETVVRFYDDIQLYPFHKAELLRLIDELEVSDSMIKDTMIHSFKRARDFGIMSESETADFVILELSGEGDKSKDLAIRAAQRAVKKIR